jgi:hypothetical protein
MAMRGTKILRGTMALRGPKVSWCFIFVVATNEVQVAARPRNKCGLSCHSNSRKHAVHFINVFWPSILQVQPLLFHLQCKEQPTCC